MKIKILSVLLVLMLLTACAGAPAGTESTEAGATNIAGGTDESAGTQTDENEASAGASTPSSDEDVQAESSEGASNGEEANGETVITTTSQPGETETGPAYEAHLAALALFGLSMEYPDFSLSGIYTASSVPLSQKESSKGIYVVFESAGVALTLHLYPLAEERSNAGTRDLFAAELGYAAFDLVESVPTGASELSRDIYAPLLSTLSSISIFTH